MNRYQKGCRRIAKEKFQVAVNINKAYNVDADISEYKLYKFIKKMCSKLECKELVTFKDGCNIPAYVYGEQGAYFEREYGLHIFNKIREEEGDYLNFDYAGYKCEIVRTQSFGTLCGYVLVPVGENYHGINCHGGITYTEKCCVEGKEYVLIGFDMAHGFDLKPLMTTMEFTWSESILFNVSYKTMDYTIVNCKSIINQLIERKKHG